MSELLCYVLVAIFFEMAGAISKENNMNGQHEIEDVTINNDDSIWESKPIEIDSVVLQILDKISGKVFKQKTFIDKVVTFGSIKIELKRAFKNSPEDNKEIYAYIEIYEKEKLIFSNWLFASSPCVNLPSHPIYDVRVEF